MLLMRNLRESLRNPLMAFGLPVAVPIVALLLVATTLLQVTYLPGFPTNNYAEWLTPPAIMCTAMSAAGYAAMSLVIDIQSGFLDRLRLLDARPRAVIVSRVLFDVLRVVPSGAAVLIVGVVLGTRVNEGVMGIVALFALLVLWTVAYGGLFFVVALRTRNPLARSPSCRSPSPCNSCPRSTPRGLFCHRGLGPFPTGTPSATWPTPAGPFFLGPSRSKW